MVQDVCDEDKDSEGEDKHTHTEDREKDNDKPTLPTNRPPQPDPRKGKGTRGEREVTKVNGNDDASLYIRLLRPASPKWGTPTSAVMRSCQQI